MPNPPVPDDLVTSAAALHTAAEYFMVKVVVGLTAAFLLAIVVLARIRRGFDPYHIVRLVSAVLIVNAILLLVAIGYDQTQIAPLLGLLAIIAGHMLSNAPRGPAPEPLPPPEPAKPAAKP